MNQLLAIAGLILAFNWTAKGTLGLDLDKDATARASAVTAAASANTVAAAAAATHEKEAAEMLRRSAWAALQPGMSKEETLELIGKPNLVAGDRWGFAHAGIITFSDDGKIVNLRDSN